VWPFLDSFALQQDAPPTPQLVGGNSRPGAGVGAGTGGQFGGFGGTGPAPPVDYGRPFRQAEVSKKARITSKPEPGFTEEAKKFNVTGVVRIRAILHTSGELRLVTVAKGLPHGLTERAVAAARRIRFEPAQKDGRAVSQFLALEYNFNIY
jgi:periplasmic protein TonB